VASGSKTLENMQIMSGDSISTPDFGRNLSPLFYNPPTILSLSLSLSCWPSLSYHVTLQVLTVKMWLSDWENGILLTC